MDNHNPSPNQQPNETPKSNSLRRSSGTLPHFGSVNPSDILVNNPGMVNPSQTVSQSPQHMSYSLPNQGIDRQQFSFSDGAPKMDSLSASEISDVAPSDVQSEPLPSSQQNSFDLHALGPEQSSQSMNHFSMSTQRFTNSEVSNINWFAQTEEEETFLSNSGYSTIKTITSNMVSISESIEPFSKQKSMPQIRKSQKEKQNASPQNKVTQGQDSNQNQNQVADENLKRASRRSNYNQNKNIQEIRNSTKNNQEIRDSKKKQVSNNVQNRSSNRSQNKNINVVNDNPSQGQMIRNSTKISNFQQKVGNNLSSSEIQNDNLNRFKHTTMEQPNQTNIQINQSKKRLDQEELNRLHTTHLNSKPQIIKERLPTNVKSLTSTPKNGKQMFRKKRPFHQISSNIQISRTETDPQLKFLDVTTIEEQQADLNFYEQVRIQIVRGDPYPQGKDPESQIAKLNQEKQDLDFRIDLQNVLQMRSTLRLIHPMLQRQRQRDDFIKRSEALLQRKQTNFAKLEDFKRLIKIKYDLKEKQMIKQLEQEEQNELKKITDPANLRIISIPALIKDQSFIFSDNQINDPEKVEGTTKVLFDDYIWEVEKGYQKQRLVSDSRKFDSEKYVKQLKEQVQEYQSYEAPDEGTSNNAS